MKYEIIIYLFLILISFFITLVGSIFISLCLIVFICNNIRRIEKNEKNKTKNIYI